MKTSAVNSPTAPQPAGGYSQAMEVVEAQRLLFISGQIPESVAGEVPTDFRAQARLVWTQRPLPIGSRQDVGE
jgi:2-iminobutanoate/2-iminopropanoate deaminase